MTDWYWIINRREYMYSRWAIQAYYNSTDLFPSSPGNEPEGLGVELLPTEYGGEAGNLEDLDKETKTMVYKYHKWMMETEFFKSDESKRIKKSSWWSLFGSSKTNNEELDEKTILKNLQID